MRDSNQPDTRISSSDAAQKYTSIYGAVFWMLMRLQSLLIMSGWDEKIIEAMK